ncbi:hypothetical protein [Enterobacter cloacae complex sp. 279F5]
MGAFSFSECILVSSEVSHLIATLVKNVSGRRTCGPLAHSGYPLDLDT